MPQWVLDMLAQASSEEELNQILDMLEQNGIATPDQTDVLFDQYIDIVDKNLEQAKLEAVKKGFGNLTATAAERQAANARKIGDYPKEITDLLDSVGSINQLDDVLGLFVNSGAMTDDEADVLYAEYLPKVSKKEIQAKTQQLQPVRKLADFESLSPSAVNYVQGFTDRNDLADRLRQLTWLTEAERHDIYDAAVRETPTAALELRQSQVRQETQEAKNKAALDDFNRSYNQALVPRMQQAMNNPIAQGMLQPLGTPSNESVAAMEDYFRQREAAGSPLSDIEKQQAIRGLTLSGQGALDYLDSVNQFAQQQGEVNRRKGNQQSDAIMRMFQGNVTNDADSAARQYALLNNLPVNLGPAPSVEPFVKEFGRTVGGENTAIRSFIEGNLPKIFEDTKAARENWWKVKNYQGAGYGMPGMSPESEWSYWNDQYEINKARAESLPKDTTLGDTFWGEGGAAAIANQAAQHAMTERDKIRIRDPEEIEADTLQAGLEAEARAKLPDPFEVAVKGKDWIAEFNRQRGVGLNRRTGAVRFR